MIVEGYVKMGWKAAEKLIRHWKILRGDNVNPPISFFSIVIFSYFHFVYLINFILHIRFITQVMIIRGKDKGETGLIKRVIRSQNRVIVEGKNLVR